MNLDRKPNLLRTLGAGTKARDGFYQTANVLIVVVISAFIGSYVTQELATPTFPDGMAIALSGTSVVLLAAVGLAVTMSRGEAGRRFLLLAAIILCAASILLTATGAGWGKGGSNMGRWLLRTLAVFGAIAAPAWLWARREHLILFANDYPSFLAVLMSRSGLEFIAAFLFGITIYLLLTHDVLYWDYPRYWDMTSLLHETVRANGIYDGFKLVVNSLGSEYTRVPAILPAVLTAGVEPISRLDYMLAVTICYAIPAYLAVGMLSFRLANGVTMRRRISVSRKGAADLVILAALASISLAPVFLASYLRNMPDIGGVAIAVAALFAAYRLIALVVDDVTCEEEQHRNIDLLATTAMLAYLLALLFLFRRWYVFFSIGLAASTVIQLAYELIRSRLPFRIKLRHVVIAVATSIVVAVSVGGEIAIHWLLTLDRRAYGDMYASYWHGWQAELFSVLGTMGMLTPALCCGIAAYLVTHASSRRLLLLLIGASLVALAGFYQIQSMAFHHYYLLMPLVGGMAGAGTMLSWQLFPRSLVVAFMLALGLWNIFFPALGGWSGYFRPEWISLRPIVRTDAPELKRLGTWLAHRVAPGDRYCVLASSTILNVTLSAGIWQLDPSDPQLLSLKTKAIHLSEVDTMSGPPPRAIAQCSIVLIGEPLQIHMAAENQQTVIIPAKDILTGSGIGAAFKKLPDEFTLSHGVRVLAYARIREIAEAELLDLRRRFYESQGSRRSQLMTLFGP